MKIKFNIDTANVADWISLYRQISTGLKRFCREIGRIPVPVIDAYQALDKIGRKGFYQFEPFLEQTGLPLAYEKTREMLESQVAENEEIARMKFSDARQHFPAIRVSGLSQSEERAQNGSAIHRFFTEQSQIGAMLEQYCRKR